MPPGYLANAFDPSMIAPPQGSGAPIAQNPQAMAALLSLLGGPRQPMPPAGYGMQRPQPQGGPIGPPPQQPPTLQQIMQALGINTSPNPTPGTLPAPNMIGSRG